MKTYVNDKQLKEFDVDVLSKFVDKVNPLMQILQESQTRFGCVPIEVQVLISKRYNFSTAKINGVVSFYSMFSLKPFGKHIVGVCTGTACYVKGAQRLVDRVVDILKVSYGETTEDGMFTLAPTRCVGDCSHAPVIMIDEKIYGNVSSDDVPKILSEYMNK
ncbi:NAD(P)H-dependent oxidoreductase subunit E [Candidatus Izimaplasma bacterium]|nr:NAD(P)H-dependent oxidoreductase subunit E [Candidatus Izimaplasma bacterium]